MATSSANEKLAMTVWFMGVVSGMGRRRVAKSPVKQGGKAMPWASVDFDAESGVI